MSKIYLTKVGTKMKKKTRLKILDAMSNPLNNGKTQKQIATLLDIHERTLRNYLTEDLWKDILKLRIDAVNSQLERVDQAVYAKAVQGDMTAARLIYGRWKEIQEQHVPAEEENQEQLKEADDEIQRLRAEIKQLEQQFSLTANKNSAVTTEETLAK